MIRVLIVDAIGSTQEAFGSVLSTQPDILLLGGVGDFSDAINQSKSCDIMLVDTNLPGDGAYHLARALFRNEDCTAVLIVGPGPSKREFVRYAEAGALGYVNLDTTPDELVENIRKVHRGNAIVPPEVNTALIGRLAELAAWYDEIHTAETVDLTRREREVLHLLGLDFTNQDIANYLIIEVGTVKNHVHSILSKLKVSSRREAANYMHLLNSRPHFNRRATPLARSTELYLLGGERLERSI
jgi:DNA-binding NarL/FixJ family response regulator